MHRIPRQQGLVKFIVFIVVIIIVLSYLGIDIQRTIESDQSKKNFSYVKAASMVVWEKYLQTPVTFLWNIFLNFIWKPVFSNLMTVTKTSTTTEIIKTASP